MDTPTANSTTTTASCTGRNASRAGKSASCTAPARVSCQFFHISLMMKPNKENNYLLTESEVRTGNIKTKPCCIVRSLGHYWKSRPLKSQSKRAKYLCHIITEDITRRCEDEKIFSSGKTRQYLKFKNRNNDRERAKNTENLFIFVLIIYTFFIC